MLLPLRKTDPNRKNFTFGVYPKKPRAFQGRRRMNKSSEHTKERIAVILRTLRFFIKEGSVRELRVMQTKEGVQSGLYDDLHAMARDAAKLDGKAPGIFFTLNPVKPALLNRSKNKIRRASKTTNDKDT